MGDSKLVNTLIHDWELAALVFLIVFGIPGKNAD